MAYELYHHGIKGMRWGIRKDNRSHTTFISDSSKTQDKNSEYYRKRLPKPIRKEIKSYIKNKDKIIVGDAPGIDRQVQDYLNKKHYKNVEVYGPGKQLRYLANKNWKAKPIDAPEFEPGSKEWLAKKDKVMQKVCSRGLAVVLENGGASATRKNVQKLIEDKKDVKVYELYSNKKYDKWV